MEEIRDENPPSSFCQNDSLSSVLGFRQIKWMSSKIAAAFGTEFPPCATFPLTNKQVHVQKVPLRAISSSLCAALKFILIFKRAALLLATSLRLPFSKPHWEFSPHVFFFFPPQSVHHAAILALSSALGRAKTSFHLYCFFLKGKMAIKVDWSEYMKSSIYEWYRYDFVLFFFIISLWKWSSIDI